MGEIGAPFRGSSWCKKTAGDGRPDGKGSGLKGHEAHAQERLDTAFLGSGTKGQGMQPAVYQTTE